MILNPWDVQSKHIHSTDGKASTLYDGDCRWGGGEIYILVKGNEMTYQKVTGTLSQGAHPGSYNGQDAYNDMLIVEEGHGRIRDGDRSGECRDHEGGVSNVDSRE